jgi:hypothetical protein
LKNDIKDKSINIRVMKRLIFLLLISISLILIGVSCSSTRKSHGSLNGLMLQDNKRLPINKVYYSQHNMKARKDAEKKFKKYVRN